MKCLKDLPNFSNPEIHAQKVQEQKDEQECVDEDSFGSHDQKFDKRKNREGGPTFPAIWNQRINVVFIP